jgi:mono/diheme cytochrome c family protein
LNARKQDPITSNNLVTIELMRQPAVFLILILFISCCAKKTANVSSGENLYKIHCQPCHPEGGNKINPAKTLSSKNLAENNIKTADDIIRIMRRGAPGMFRFDEKFVSEDEARKIAEYIFQAFR